MRVGWKTFQFFQQAEDNIYMGIADRIIPNFQQENLKLDH